MFARVPALSCGIFVVLCDAMTAHSHFAPVLRNFTIARCGVSATLVRKKPAHTFVFKKVQED